MNWLGGQWQVFDRVTDGMTFERIGATIGVAEKCQGDETLESTSNQAPAPLMGCLLLWNYLRFEHVTV